MYLTNGIFLLELGAKLRVKSSNGLSAHTRPGAARVDLTTSALI